MKKMILCLLLTALAYGMGCSPKGNPAVETAAAAETAAVAASQSWLLLVDAEQYGESWDQAAQVFQSAISKEQWLQAMQVTRKPLGANLTRELKSKRYLTSLPGAPDGEYVVIQFTASFQASFQNKNSAVETITPMMDKDGTWRVSGYYLVMQ